MAPWLISPYVGLGPIKLSSTRTVIRALLGDGFKSFQKTPASNVSDVYEEYGLHLYYDSEDLLEFIESYEPCEPMYEDMKFLRRSIQRTTETLKKKGFQVRERTGSYIFDDLGFVLYAPYTKIEAVSVFRHRYYK